MVLKGVLLIAICSDAYEPYMYMISRQHDDEDLGLHLIDVEPKRSLSAFTVS